MYENYLLRPDAIVAITSGIDGFRKSPLTAAEVKAWLDAHGWDGKYFGEVQRERTANAWLREVHGAKLPTDLFSHFSDTRVHYDKVRHGVALTDWLLENAPEELREVSDLLNTSLAAQAPKARGA